MTATVSDDILMPKNAFCRKNGNRMVIKRDGYLNKLVERQNNGMVKVITGIRRCGKSFLLFKLYKEYLLSNMLREVILNSCLRI